MHACKLCRRDKNTLAMHGLCNACWRRLKKKILKHILIINEHEKIIYYSFNYEAVLSSLNIIEKEINELLQYKNFNIEINKIVEILPPSPSGMEEYIGFCKNEYKKVFQEKAALDKELEDDEPIGKKYQRDLSIYKANKESFRRVYKIYSKNRKQKLKTILSVIRRITYILKVQTERNAKANEFEITGNIDKTIALHEKNVHNELWKKESYDRLLKLYRDKKLYDDELRIAEKAKAVFGGKKYKKRYNVVVKRLKEKK